MSVIFLLVEGPDLRRWSRGCFPCGLEVYLPSELEMDCSSLVDVFVWLLFSDQA